MFLFAHVGITLAVAAIGEQMLLWSQKRSLLKVRLSPGRQLQSASGSSPDPPVNPPSAAAFLQQSGKSSPSLSAGSRASAGEGEISAGLTSRHFRSNREFPGVNYTGTGRRLAERMAGLFDLRFWALGSMLPDIIDKPTGHFLFSQTFHNNGRIFAHSLLFLLAILIAGLLWNHFSGRKYLLAVAGGSFMHLVLDSMWHNPQTLFWPLKGWNFPWYGEGDWIGSMLQALRHDPSTFLPEIIGVLVFVGLFGVLVLRKGNLVNFLKTGKLY